MNTRERFGNYVLLKKLAEDPLGEVFRAGRFGSQGIEQVVLLRVFNGQGLDSARLWQQVSQRGDVQSIIKSPNLGQGVDFGELQGVPFVVYDYISGKDLATLMVQARKQRSPVPGDHALLITERIALGLSAAYENRRQGSRILHGFVIPSLVMVSNEGEARLLGFEAGPGLRELSRENAALKPLERYVAPEVLAGQPADKADDVYSLGVILFELLTGQDLSNARALSLDSLIDEAVVAGDEGPIPPAISSLLKRSLAPREQRIPDCVAWHKNLSQLMIDSHYNPTTFNLAFFMHNLFQDEIERESREIQVEKNFEDSGVEIPATTGAAGAAGAETMMVSASDIAPATAVPRDEEGNKRGWLGILAAVVALAVVGGLGYWFFLGPGSSKPVAVAEIPITEPVAEPEPVPAGPTQEEIQAELERMREEMAEAMAAQSEEMRKALADQYEGKLKELEGQYDQSQKALQERRRREQEEALAAQQATIEAEARKRAELKQVDAGKQAAPSEPTGKAQAPAGQKPGGTPAAGGPAAGGTQPAGQKAASQEAATQKPAVQRTEPEKAVAPAPPPSPPPVRVGDLVQAGPGVIAPKLLDQVPPKYPSAARRMRREATVIVRVLVDERGKVVKAERLGKKVGMGIDESALSAAEASTFTPATKNGVRVKMWHSLRFDFRP